MALEYFKKDQHFGSLDLMMASFGSKEKGIAREKPKENILLLKI